MGQRLGHHIIYGTPTETSETLAYPRSEVRALLTLIHHIPKECYKLNGVVGGLKHGATLSGT
jgi:hypothetical protein